MTQDKQRKLYKVVIYLKSRDTVSTETHNLEAFKRDLQRYLDEFHNRRWWKRPVSSVVNIIGDPVVVLPLDNISFFTFHEITKP